MKKSDFESLDDHVQSRLVGSRLSYKEALDKAAEQVNLECFNESDVSLASEILANMAEVFMLWDNAPVRIAGSQIDGFIIKQVFEQVREEHVQLVIENLKRVETIISYKKSYIRTALYNSVFEIELHYTNRVKHDIG